MSAKIEPGIVSEGLGKRDLALSVLRKYKVSNKEIEEILSLAAGDDARLYRLATRKRFGEPNAYLRGYSRFFGREFHLDRRCYIPDEHARELAERVLRDAPSGGRVLEVGTGCGWLSISLKCERPDLEIVACDIDPNALCLARANAERHGVDITFCESFFVDDVNIPEPDCIVANVPYGGDADYSARELEERPQMPPIAICDSEGVVGPLLGLVASVQNRGWRSPTYLETGYLDQLRLDPVVSTCRRYQHVRNGEFGYLVIEP
ncbi:MULTISPECIES: class I SAM-dependent methyltransferase [unclassified Mesorhizobium]|uniref:methyltransferase n=1 Tax=unclassified Mesorhizobium TaxID=325217 RepID=UPI000FCCCC60|nr:MULTISPECIES: class I SAM-dependent methyltransferase [unclassified Mesorhizobium]RUW72701.1 methyltransferase domain-containing protein [Mesorhizobium sp. M1E.F.Ca.ET.063.01.1.1]RWA78187.1 MAG: methyltransferase domain-containing protein [Mesorhizobium sp.]TIS47431.1 MAG: methyltransferase domain-containing protein [Mesorhizobium sp.]